MVSRCVTGRSAIFLVLWIASAAASSGNVASRIDAVYRALGRGDNAQALSGSLWLVEHTAADSTCREDALQARLDVLTQTGNLIKPSGMHLHDLAVNFSQHTRMSWLLERFAIARAVASGDSAAVARIGEQVKAQLARVPATEQIELRSAVSAALAETAGRLDQARALAEPASVAWQRRPGAKARWHEVRLKHLLARAYADAGDARRALNLLTTASKTAASAFGRDSALRIQIDITRAGQLSSMGLNNEGLRVRESVLSGTRHRYGADSNQVAQAEAVLGAGLQEIGDYGNAREHYARAQAVLRRITDAPVHEQVVIYANYGNLLQEMGAENEALKSYRHALHLLGSGPQSAHIRAVIMANVGNTEFRVHDYARARTDFHEALALRERSDGRRSPGLSYSLEGLGSASLALQNYAEAEHYFRRALTLRGLTMAPNHPTLGPLRFGLALAFWGQGNVRGAFDLAVRTARHEQAVLATFAAGFAERQSMAYRELLIPATALAVTLAAKLGDAASIRTAWHLSMVEHGLVERAQAYRLAAARARTDPATAAALARWQKINRALGDAWFEPNTDPNKITGLRRRAEEAERAMWPRQLARRQAAASSIPIADLKRALPEDGLLIAYTEGVSSQPSRAMPAGDQLVPEDWYAFCLDRSGALRLRRIGNIRALSAQIRAWYLDLRSPTSDLATLRADGFALRHAVLDPFVGNRRVGHLFVIPEGELYRMSFAALPAMHGRGYLIESFAGVHTLGNESDLLLPPLALSHPLALLAGAPDFGAPSEARATVRNACDGFRTARLAPIPNARRELDALRNLLSEPAVNARIIELSGAGATKRDVVSALTHANLVHLATHGFVLDDDCPDKAGTRGVSLAGAIPPRQVLSAAGFSGLAFVENPTDVGSGEVGVLSAGELASLNLANAAWIVLSACDSGLGLIGRNEGVFGMRRALRIAGARTVIMSLWQIDDAATVSLMRSLYRARFLTHQDVSEAMGQAMRDTLKRRRDIGLSDHPYYWAAFVSEGAWR